MKGLLLTLCLGWWGQCVIPEKENMMVSQIEFQLILWRMDRTPGWGPAAHVLRNQRPPLHSGMWMQYNMYAYFAWQDAYQKHLRGEVRE